MWAIAAIDDAEVPVLKAGLEAAMAEYFGTEAFARYVELMAWWGGGGDSEEFFFEPVPGWPWLQPTAAAERFASLVDLANPNSDAYDDLACRCMRLMPDGGEGAFAATARKASPAAALHYGLGAAGSALLPGRFGEFLLSHAEVLSVVAGFEQALALTGQHRSRVIERARRWLAEFGDVPDADVDELLDGPLRVVRLAAKSGQGVVGVVAWY
ncbi:hypothetical protein ABH935_006713 [Catenulispora sp. GAS73]|uniref:hypothetical protein n=1 Tax=Catenulispora sp. GAS73 TaxID=3156269 RepID=UPI003514DDA3